MTVLSALVMLAGALFTLVAGIGLHRFDDVFARMHAAGKSTTFGLGLILAGAALRLGEPGAVAKLGLVGLFGVLTIPAGVHLIARAAWRSGTEHAPGTRFDDHARARARSHADSGEDGP